MLRRVKNILLPYFTSKFFESFIITLLGSGLSRVILSVAVFIFANYLTKAEFGEFSYIRNTLNTILCICALNFSSICTKFVVDLETDKAAVGRLVYLFTFIFFIAFIIGALLLFVPSTIWVRIFKGYKIYQYFKFIGVFLPVFIMQPMIEGILRGLLKFKLIGILQVSTSFFFIISVVAGYYLSGLSGAIWGMMCYYSVYSFISIACIVVIRPFKGIAFKWSEIVKSKYVVSKILIPIFITSFIEAPILWLAQLFLIRWNNIEAVGSATAILQIRSLVIIIPSYVFSTFLSFASKLNAQQQYVLYFKRFARLSKILIWSGLGVALFLSIFSKQVLGLYGDEYRIDYVAMIISNLEIPLLLYVGLLKLDLIIQEHQKQLMYISVIWNIIWLLLLYVLFRIGLDSIVAFFLSQLCALSIYSIYVYIQYKKDKIVLCSNTSNTLDDIN